MSGCRVQPERQQQVIALSHPNGDLWFIVLYPECRTQEQADERSRFVQQCIEIALKGKSS